MLGVTFTVDLKWNAHVDEIVSKVNKRLYFLRQLKHAQVKSKERQNYGLYSTECYRICKGVACFCKHSKIGKLHTYIHTLFGLAG